MIVRSCAVHLVKALGGGHARSSRCHILLNVVLTPAFPSNARKLQSSFSICWQINDNTLPETNVVPENRSCQKESSIPTIHFQVLC